MKGKITDIMDNSSDAKPHIVASMQAVKEETISSKLTENTDNCCPLPPSPALLLDNFTDVIYEEEDSKTVSLASAATTNVSYSRTENEDSRST
eukprot:15356250-Ditylum_brightwellii.AAC.1